MPGGATTTGLQLTQAACGQSFTLTPLSSTSDTYTIATAGGRCVDVSGAGTADNAQIIRWSCNSQTNQRFQLLPSGTGTFNLAAAHSGKCIAASGSAAGLVQLPCSTAASRVWRLAGFPTGGGTTHTFTNPLKTQGPNPWLTYYQGFYYLATTTWNNTITMRRSATLGGLASAADQTIFTLTRPNGAGNPWTAAGTRHVLSTPTYGWETVGGAVNEGAEVLQRNGKTFIVFSASHCSTPDYKLGVLTYNGGDPLNASSWVKSSQPVFQRNNAAAVYGPGHNGFFKSPDGTEDWIVYHATNNSRGNCDLNRSTRAQKISWNPDGTPNFGTPVGLGVTLTAPESKDRRAPPTDAPGGRRSRLTRKGRLRTPRLPLPCGS